MTDFELGLRNAMRTVYGEKCQINGCYFHFTQAVRRKCRKIKNFFRTICNNPQMYEMYHMVLALPHLAGVDIDGAFEDLKEESTTFGPVFDEFMVYFGDQWLRNVC